MHHEKEGLFKWIVDEARLVHNILKAFLFWRETAIFGAKRRFCNDVIKKDCSLWPDYGIDWAMGAYSTRNVHKLGANMNKLALIVLSALALGAGSPKPTPEVPSTTPQSQSLEDIDYQITITKQALERYKAQVYMMNEQAESVMSRDYMGYREDEVDTQRAQQMVDSLQQRLQELEAQRDRLSKTAAPR